MDSDEDYFPDSSQQKFQSPLSHGEESKGKEVTTESCDECGDPSDNGNVYENRPYDESLYADSGETVHTPLHMDVSVPDMEGKNHAGAGTPVDMADFNNGNPVNGMNLEGPMAKLKVIENGYGMPEMPPNTPEPSKPESKKTSKKEKKSRKKKNALKKEAAAAAAATAADAAAAAAPEPAAPTASDTSLTNKKPRKPKTEPSMEDLSRHFSALKLRSSASKSDQNVYRPVSALARTHIESSADDEDTRSDIRHPKFNPTTKLPADYSKYPGTMEVEDETDSSAEDVSHYTGNMYNPVDFENLTVDSETKELFQYITRFIPHCVELENKLKPFIPDFIPAVGDIDAMLKVPRPDKKPDTLGFMVLDEPRGQQSDPGILDLKLRALSKCVTNHPLMIRSIQNAHKNPKAIHSWVFNIEDLHRIQPPSIVHYTKDMPDVDALMVEWPTEVEEVLKEITLPSADMDVPLETFVDMACATVDIPIKKSRIQSLHLLFSLYLTIRNAKEVEKKAKEVAWPLPPPPKHSIIDDDFDIVDDDGNNDDFDDDEDAVDSTASGELLPFCGHSENCNNYYCCNCVGSTD